MLKDGAIRLILGLQSLSRRELVLRACQVEAGGDVALQAHPGDCHSLPVIGDRLVVDRVLRIQPAQREIVTRQFRLQAEPGRGNFRSCALREVLLSLCPVADLIPQVWFPRRRRLDLIRAFGTR